jgi:hypothetical protein
MNRQTAYRDVFDHNADPEALERLRSAVIHDAHWMCNVFPGAERVTADHLDPDVYRALREKYRPLLHACCGRGSFNLPKPRTLADELIWKWTEATGKYVGCQFWSVSAKALFDFEVKGWPITPKRARAIEKTLSAKDRPSNARLTHEHVYPRKELRKDLRMQKLSRNEIRELFDRLCVSCVVLESEHDQLRGGDVKGDLNPWERYARANIVLAENPRWQPVQRNEIADAYR